MTVKPPAPPPLPDELDRLLRRLRHAICPPGGAGGDRHRDRATLGSRRGPARPPRRGGRRPRPGHDQHAPPRIRAAGRQDVRRLGAGPLARSQPRPSRRCKRSNGSTAPKYSSSAARSGTGKIASSSKRSAISRSTKARTVAWHTLESLAAAVPPPPRRRQHQQSDQQTDPRRSHPDRRCRAAPGFRRRRRRAVPGRSTPPTRNARSRSARTSIPRGSTS